MQKKKTKDGEEYVLGSENPLARQRFEFYLFVLCGTLFWCIIAYYSLRYLKFPFHAHPFEALGIFLFPVILIILVLKLIDFTVRIKED